jgi:hypothetical protein
MAIEREQPTPLVVALDRLGVPDTTSVRSGLALALFQASPYPASLRFRPRCKSPWSMARLLFPAKTAARPGAGCEVRM